MVDGTPSFPPSPGQLQTWFSSARWGQRCRLAFPSHLRRAWVRPSLSPTWLENDHILGCQRRQIAAGVCSRHPRVLWPQSPGGGWQCDSVGLRGSWRLCLTPAGEQCRVFAAGRRHSPSTSLFNFSIILFISPLLLFSLYLLLSFFPQSGNGISFFFFHIIEKTNVILKIQVDYFCK